MILPSTIRSSSGEVASKEKMPFSSSDDTNESKSVSTVS